MSIAIPRIFRWPSSRPESGATLLEFAIILPLFMFLLFAIVDFSAVISQRILFSRALSVAARASGLGGGNTAEECFANGLRAFRQELMRYRTSDDSFDAFSGALTSLSDLNANVLRSRSFSLAVDARPNCLLCPMILARFGVGFSGAGGEVGYRLASFVPLADAADCRDTDDKPARYMYLSNKAFRCDDADCYPIDIDLTEKPY